MRERGRDLCKVAPEQVRGDSVVLSTVTGSFAATAAQDDATGSVYGDAGTRAASPIAGDMNALREQKRKGPSRIYLKGPVNPAATYSPGSEDQVPSAI